MAVVLTAVIVAIGLAATALRRRGDRDERSARKSTRNTTRNTARNTARNATPQPAPTHSAASLSTEKELVR
jgi:raffinose/stachyose/melibiose transport system permease protein